MTDYADRLKAHLADYRRERLGVTEDGIWRGNKRPYPHILPESKHQLNILEPIRDSFWKYFEANRHRVGLHTDFHHLNSSQACGFNLLFPWLNEPSLQPRLLNALGLAGEEVKEWHFEHIPDQKERTSVDCFLKIASGAEVLIEIKLTEGHFGLAQSNPNREAKRTNTYLPRLDGKLREGGVPDNVFFLNYQLFRNLSHLNLVRGDQLLLVLPRANEFTWAQGAAFREYLAPEAAAAVRLIEMEDMVRLMTVGAGESDSSTAHLAQFREKYALDEWASDTAGVGTME